MLSRVIRLLLGPWRLFVYESYRIPCICLVSFERAALCFGTRNDKNLPNAACHLLEAMAGLYLPHDAVQTNTAMQRELPIEWSRSSPVVFIHRGLSFKYVNLLSVLKAGQV